MMYVFCNEPNRNEQKFKKNQKSQHQRSVETLSLSGNGDSLNIVKKGKNVNRINARKGAR